MGGMETAIPSPSQIHIILCPQLPAMLVCPVPEPTLPSRAPDLPLSDIAYHRWSLQGCRVRWRQSVLFVYLQGMKAKLEKDFATVQPSDYKVLL